MAFNVSYIAGGVIDKVRELPYPHFSKKTIPFIRGQMLDIPASKTTKSDTFTLAYDTEFLSIAFAASHYCVGDYWELMIGTEKVCRTIYTKELPESVSMGNSFGIVYPIPAGTPITFDFYNAVAEAKSVWYNIKFLR
ncbi:MULTISPECIES: hypothetical protein [unclassified Paenibacillus]|uniref:hypothetical protein n=1 Tax=unclassified Paenibacillus TaxID=185978 RepID=UPI0030D93B77